MERSRISLHKWFFAIFLFSTSRHGIAAKELQRRLKVAYKTAWRMAHEIRKYMAEVDGESSLGGVIDAECAGEDMAIERTRLLCLVWRSGVATL